MNIQNEYFLKPGYIYVSNKKIILKTILGSCVSICLWDKINNNSGMNHFIYPKKNKNNNIARYGDVAIPYLIKLMLKLNSRKENLIAHVIGGANNPAFSSSIGIKNVEIAKELLRKHNIKVVSWDIGGTVGKKVSYNTFTREILVEKCSQIKESDWH